MRQIPAESKSARCQPEETETGEIKKEGLLTMNLPYSVTQKDLFEILLNIAPSRPVFIWGRRESENRHSWKALQKQ